MHDPPVDGGPPIEVQAAQDGCGQSTKWCHMGDKHVEEIQQTRNVLRAVVEERDRVLAENHRLRQELSQLQAEHQKLSAEFRALRDDVASYRKAAVNGGRKT